MNKIKDLLSEYIKVKLELIKLDLTEHVSTIIARTITYLIIMLIATFALGFASLGAAHTINTYYNSATLGYWVLAGSYSICLVGILLYVKSGKLDLFIEAKISEVTDEIDSEEGGKNG